MRGEFGIIRQPRTVEHGEALGGDSPLSQHLFDRLNRAGRRIIGTDMQSQQSAEFLSQRIVGMPKHERHDLIQRCGMHGRDGTGAFGNRSLFHGRIHGNALFSQTLREHLRGLAGRLRTQSGVCAEHIGIRGIGTVPVTPAIHRHGRGRRVVHVVRV